MKNLRTSDGNNKDLDAEQRKRLRDAMRKGGCSNALSTLLWLVVFAALGFWVFQDLSGFGGVTRIS